MDNRNYLVIGGSGGIGRSMAILLAETGSVYIISRSQPKIENMVNTTWIQSDVLKDEFPANKLPDRLDGLVYCPGTINLKPFHALKIDDFKDDFNVNLLGAVRSLQATVSRLKKSEDPAVVLLSTVAVGKGMSFHSSIAAAKGAVEGLVRSLAAEWAPKIRVNAIAPSLTDTPLASKILSSESRLKSLSDRHPLNRIGQPEDIAHLAVFLLGPHSSWITGQVIGVDGGLSNIQP